MCKNPVQHEGLTFACHYCWQCIENRTQDWVGRCIAQSKTSTMSYYFTFTYGGGDHERARVLTYSDVQKYFKRVRNAGYKFKYLVAGEYGGQFGRTHWHVIQFFEGDYPEVVLSYGEEYTRFQYEYWPHGHTVCKEMTPPNIRYCCKYIRKDVNDKEAQAKFMVSKKPPIGHEWFRNFAHRHVDDGIPPHDLMYQFRENRGKDGKPVKHYMHDVTADNFIEAFIKEWRRRHGNDNWPYSQLVDEYLDSLVNLDDEPRLEARRPVCRVYFKPRNGTEPVFREKLNTFVSTVGGKEYLWRRSLKKGKDWSWQSAGKELLEITYKDRAPEKRKPAPLITIEPTPRGPNEVEAYKQAWRTMRVNGAVTLGDLVDCKSKRPMRGDWWNAPAQPSPRPSATSPSPTSASQKRSQT